MSRKHIVRQGECLSQIARAYGFRDYRNVYGHADNAALRRLRPNPNVLHPGDEVVIPDPEKRTYEVGTAKVHRFEVKRPARALHVVFQDETGEPLAELPYTLRFRGIEKADRTTGDGSVRHDLPMDVEYVEIEILGTRRRFQVGHLDPLWDDEKDAPVVSGVQARLSNLGFSPGRIDGVVGDRACRQDDHGRQAVGPREG